MTVVIALVAAILVGIGGLLAVFLAGMHWKWGPVVDTVRVLNLRVMNPSQMKTAGTPGAFAGILRHTGRSSGRTYETPLGIEPTEDGFVIAMIYGERTQWSRNVLAAGSAEVIVGGRTYRVDRPEIVPIADAIGYVAPSDRRLTGLFGVTECLRVYHAEHG